MWLRELEREQLEYILRESICSYMASGFEGEIFWASDSFLEWTGYTSAELQKIGWKKLSVDDENFEADLIAAKEIQEGTRISYQVEKRYIPKHGSPKWGILYVKRVPQFGPLRFCWCHWSPIHEDYSKSFEVAVSHIKANEVKIELMTNTLKSLTDQTPEQKWVGSTVQMMMKYPKATITILAIGLLLSGFNNVLEIFQRVGLIPPTIKIQEVSTPANSVEAELEPLNHSLVRLK